MNRPPNNADLRRFTRLLTKGDCWLYTGTQGTSDGYGHFIPYPGAQRVMAHKWAYEVYVGPIPEGMQIDHRCHTAAVAAGTCPGGADCPHRRCCRPDHLEAVTPSENTTRQNHDARNRTECPKGHPYDEENTHVGADGKRRCRTCRRESRNRTRVP